MTHRPAFLDHPALLPVLAALPGARPVGGCVRDALAGLDPADIDLATPLAPPAVIAALHAAGLRAIPTGLRHGTVTALSQGRGFQITTLRRDLATDGRHATVAFTEDWRADAARRDFTINAMSLDPAAPPGAALHDYFGGAEDLAAGRLRFVGDPAARLAEDWLRALRFFRFFARFATTPPDPATRDALRHAAAHLHRLSGERVQSELLGLLATAAPWSALALMHRLGVLPAILPGADPARLDRLRRSHAPPDPLLRLAALLAGRPAPDRLRLSSAQAARLAALAGPAPPARADAATLVRLAADTPPALLADRALLAHDDPAPLLARLAALTVPVFPLSGQDALDAGIPPGPAIGAALAAIRAWWRNGACTADRAACLARLSTLGSNRAD